MSFHSNLANLTRSHNLIAAKKARKREQIKEILFDDDARRDFLTGFHKRKLAKAEAARSKAKERQKQERLEARREQRQSLREQAKENAAQVEQAYGAHIAEVDDDDDDEQEWTGITHEPNAEQADEYEDEEQLATVTVVEDFDPDTLIHGPPKSDNHIPSSSSSRPVNPSSSSRPTTKPPSSKKPTSTKTKPKKIRYEIKAARQRERTKQHARRTEKAELAGGKASRKSNVRSKSKRHNSKR